MASVNNLFHVSDGLGAFLGGQLPGVQIVLGPPPDVPVVTEEVRVTLVYVSQQPSHRNDGFVRDADGTAIAPPLSLSAFYLVTTYGEAPSQNVEGAHRLLGAVARAFHDQPVLDLSLFSTGEGALQVAMVPMTPELMEKLFSPFKISHRPFLLYEVWPVQLRSGLPAVPPSTVVSPGGLRLDGPATDGPPTLTRVVPQRPALDRFIRIDGPFGAPADSVRIGNAVFRAGSGDFVPVDPASPELGVRLQLDPTRLQAGVHSVTVTTGTTTSRAVDIEIQPAFSLTLDGPSEMRHSQASGPLELTGEGLGTAAEVLVWPDAGIGDPSEVVDFTVANVNANKVDFTPTGLDAGLYRIAVRVTSSGADRFTPYVVMELEP
ncbi:MAG: Pvc16 family protein [Myxococcota bacterium]